MRQRKDKWVVYGEYGDSFTNLKDAKECAKRISTYDEYRDEEVSVCNLIDGCYYIDYMNGKCVRDGWTIKK